MNEPSNSSYGRVASLLPATNNIYLLQFGEPALYSTALVLIVIGLLQHALVFGLIFLLRGFNPVRALDLHFLTIVFALTFPVAALVFVVDRQLDIVKLNFFLEHEAIELLIVINIFAANACKRHPWRILLTAWTVLAALTVTITFDESHRHGAEIVAWMAFVSDGTLCLAGIKTCFKWWVAQRTRTMVVGDDMQSKSHMLAGAGFVLHGCTTMPIAPIFTRLLYSETFSTSWFSYAWVVVFSCAFIVIALCVPSATIWFSNISWCCSHKRRRSSMDPAIDLEDGESKTQALQHV